MKLYSFNEKNTQPDETGPSMKPNNPKHAY